MPEPAAQTPGHVPSDLIVDFDFMNPEGAEGDPYAALKRLHDGPDIVWTPRNGGHWIATRGEDIVRILSDYENFSSRAVFIPSLERPPFIPLEIDPPRHEAYRNLLIPAFHPATVTNWSREARELAIKIIDDLYPKGECEFISAFARQLPIIIFLRMCDLPLQDREMLLDWLGANLRPKDNAGRDQARKDMSDYVFKWTKIRQADPGGDLLSQIVTAEIDDRPLSNREIHAIILGLFGAGLDTTTSCMGWMARFMAEHPQHRKQLIDDPKLIPNAIDELLRRFSIANIARVVVRNMDYKGIGMKQGEQILLPTCLHGMDERMFDNPMEVDFHRDNARRHSAFSQGIHRCPGINLAQEELRIFLDEWLRQIPEFRIKPGATVVTCAGIVHSVEHLPLVWEVD